MSDINQDWTEEAKERHRQIGLDWVTDSRLEKWFPFTAEELTTLRERVRLLEGQCDCLNLDLARAGISAQRMNARIRELEEIDRQQTITINRYQMEWATHTARIRELEEVMPHPSVLRSWALDADAPAFYTAANGIGKPLRELADRIEKVMHARPSVDGKP